MYFFYYIRTGWDDIMGIKLTSSTTGEIAAILEMGL